MCKALDDLYQDGVNEGREQGIEQGIRALMQDYLDEGYDREKILEKLQKIFSLSREKAELYYMKFHQPQE